MVSLLTCHEKVISGYLSKRENNFIYFLTDSALLEIDDLFMNDDYSNIFGGNQLRFRISAQ